MVEIIPKQKKEGPAIVTFLTYGAVLLFLAAGGTFLFLQNLESRTTATLHYLEGVLAAEKTIEELRLERTIFLMRDKLADFKTLVNSRNNPEGVFVFLEETTHPQVFFSDVHVNSLAQTVDLRGAAASFRILGDQMAVLQERKEVQALQVSAITLGKTGNVQFSLELVFLPEVFSPQ